jgi:acyl carrier protein
MDLLELVMEIEDEFKIKIPDEDAELICTTGQAYEYIARRLEGQRGEVCLSAASFYRLRRAIMAVCAAGRSAVCPKAPLERFISLDRRREVWKRLSDELQLKLPPLQVAPSIRTTFGCLAGMGALIAWPTVAAALWMAGLWTAASIGLGFLACIVVGIVGLSIADFAWRSIPENRARNFANGVVTVGHLATEVTWLNHDALHEQTGRRGAIENYDLWERLQQIVCEHLGADPCQVTWNAHFVRDLGAD